MPGLLDYTVAWICQLEVEHTAAFAFLDEMYPTSAPHDSNLYITGRVGAHNVVIAVPRNEKDGAVSVDVVWRDALHCFPNLRMALVLSVTACAPNTKYSMRPGDVLVGHIRNENRTSSQHEEAIQELPSQDTGVPGQHLASLRTAVQELRQEHEQNGHRLERQIQNILQKWPQLKEQYSRPVDAAVVSDLERHPYVDSDDNNLRLDDSSNDLPRRTRDAQGDLGVHYSFMAHVNQQADGVHRSGEAVTESPNCYSEPQAADLTDKFPCLIVRGICNAAVQNENETWRGFAALAAAAYTKDLLRHIPPQQEVSEPPLDEVAPKCPVDCQGKGAPVDGYCCNEAAQAASSDTDTAPIAALSIPSGQKLHVEEIDALSVAPPSADMAVTSPSIASYVTCKLERERQRDAYINAIRTDDVLKLASWHNNGKECVEFRKHENGSFNVCFFVEFPSDGQKWVVRFPICPVIYEPWQKLQSEVATMEFIQINTTIPIPRVYGYGKGGDGDGGNVTGLPYVILEYVVGQPLDPKALLTAPADVVQKFYAQLGDALSQLWAQQFEYAGSISKNGAGFFVSSPRSVDLNSIQIQGRRERVSRQRTAFDFAMCHYEILAERLSLPAEEMDEGDAQHELFGLEDLKMRLPRLMNPCLNFEPFVLAHGDLRPSNIIVSQDFTIQGIIDWEWSGTVPREFFMPPIWFGGREVSSPGNELYCSQYSILYQALLDAGDASDACRSLALEWGPNLGSSYRLFLPQVLLYHHAFMTAYYLALFPKFYKGLKRQEKLEAFYKSSRVFREAVRVKVEESRRYTERLIADGLLNPEIKKAEDAKLDALLLKSAELLGKGVPGQAVV